MKLRTALPALVFVTALCIAAVLTGCSSSGTSQSGSDDTPDSAESPSSDTSGDYTKYKEETMHTSTVEVTGTETAVIQTSKGAITLEFYPADAPNTVATFIELADAGFYDGLKFHRVVPGFVAQGGDPLTRDLSAEQIKAGIGGAGTGGPGWTQKAEFNSRPHETGTLAMARARDVDSAGSQFYICLAPQPSLDRQYTVFGKVTEGMDVVTAIEVGDVIESVTIER